MDKDQIEDSEVNEQEDDAVETTVTEPNEQDQAEPAVVIKKSGSGFSLLLSVVALGIAGYLFYQNWQQDDSPIQAVSSQAEIEQLQQANQSLGVQLSEAKAEIQQLKTQLSAVQQGLAEVKNLANQQPGAADPFDNSANERSLQQLEQQLEDQVETIRALQQQFTSLSLDSGVREMSPELLNQIQSTATVQTLLTTQTLLDTGQIGAAASGLDRYLSSAHVSAAMNRQLQQLANRIRQIETPDTASLKQSLQNLVEKVKSLELPTVEAADEGHWYDRFISVKKISDDSELTSSVQLMELKMQLDRQLYQAGLNLTMQQQTGWQDTLNQSANLLAQQLSTEQALVEQIKSLAAQKVVADVPADLNIDVLIKELKGLDL